MSKAAQHYDLPSRIFHWLTAMAVAVAFVLGPERFGRLMRSGVDPATRWDIVWHESLGLLVFGLTVLRLLWVLLRPAKPRFEAPAWSKAISHLVHGLLWLLLLALPATALLELGGKGHPLTVLGGVRVQDMTWIAQLPFARTFDWGDVHKFLGDAVMWLAGLHALGALFHHVVLRDGLLLAMLKSPSRH
jgi:cytochrome b561